MEGFDSPSRASSSTNMNMSGMSHNDILTHLAQQGSHMGLASDFVNVILQMRTPQHPISMMGSGLAHSHGHGYYTSPSSYDGAVYMPHSSHGHSHSSSMNMNMAMPTYPAGPSSFFGSPIAHPRAHPHHNGHMESMNGSPESLYAPSFMTQQGSVYGYEDYGVGVGGPGMVSHGSPARR